MTGPASFEEDPEHPGWRRWALSDPTRFNSLLGPFLVRKEPGGGARVRMFPEHRHSNLGDSVHGGALLGFVDVALFATSRHLGLIEAGTAVTVDLSVQFVGAGAVGRPLDAVVELLRATRRLLFLRGLVVQEDVTVASFGATVRKPTGR